MAAVGTRYDEDNRWLVVARGDVTIACNFAETEVTIPIEASRTAELLLTSAKEPERSNTEVRLPGASVTIWRS
jgi:maltooligosyltrehalose trehalohydrolase